MADTSTPAMTISKLKVADLKKELKSRGLSTVGNKTELTERLQEALQGDGALSLEPDSGTGDDRDAEDLIDEDDVLAEDESLDLGDDVKEDTKLTTPSVQELEEVKTPPKKVVLKRSSVSVLEKENQEEQQPLSEDDKEETKPKIIKLTKLTELERLEMRAKKFGASAEANEKKAPITSGEKSPTPDASVDLLKKRAERFGSALSKTLIQVEQDERIKKRQERFGIVSSTDSELKKMKRGARFGTATAKTAVSVSPDDAEKLKKRAERFNIK